MPNSHNSGYFPGNPAGLVAGNGDPVILGGGIALGTNGILTAQKTLKLSNKGSIRRFGGGGFTDSNPGYTFASVMQLPGPFRQTRVGFYNPTANTSKSIGGNILLGATASSTNYFASDSTGAATPSGFVGMKPVGFEQGGGATSSPINSQSACIPNHTPTVTIASIVGPVTAGDGQAGVFGRMMTDWTYTPSMPRSDGGNGNLLSVVVDVPTSIGSMIPCIAVNSGTGGITDYTSAGITYKQAFVSGSQSGSLSAMSTTMNNGSANYGKEVVHVVEAIFENKALTIGWIGDSISDLPNSAGAITGRPTVIELCSQLMTTASLPVCAHNMSWFGQPLRNYIQWAMGEVPNCKHMGACVIQAWSGNDPYDSDPNGWAGLVAAFTQDIAAILTEQGCQVILATPAQIGTRFGTSSGYQNLWVQEDARIRGLGYPILDLGALWGQPSSPWLFKSGFDVGDGLHPAASSVALAANSLQSILTPMLP